MATGITKLSDGITKRLDDMVKRVNLVPGYLSRVVYRKYQNVQRERWASENTNRDVDGGAWHALDPSYADYKRRKYKGYPGGGTKLLIRTKRLLNSVVGPSTEQSVIVDKKSIHIYTLVPYAKYVDEVRTFSKYSDIFKRDILRGLRDYVAKGIARQL